MGNIVILIIIISGFIAWGIYKQVKKAGLASSGEITKRSTKDLTKKAEIFTAEVKNLKAIYEKLEERDLAKYKIRMELSAKQIKFISGSAMKHGMEASLTDLGNNKYKLVVDNYTITRTNGIKTGTSGVLEMNIVFTAVEKVMLELDKNTEVEEEFVKRS
jgi:hypothetical protein